MIPKQMSVRRNRNLGNYETIHEEIMVELEPRDSIDAVFFETARVIDEHLEQYKKEKDQKGGS